LGHEVHHAGAPGLTSTASNGTPVPYLRGRAISKSFGHVRALQDVDIDVFGHEVLAIVGDNGAGKSTLTKILSGVVQPDRGDIFVGQEKVRIRSARKAHELGVATVFQTLALVNCRDVACNLFLGREPTFWRIFVDRRKMIADARAAFAELGVNIPTLLAEAGELSGGQRQCVAIARATSQYSRIIIMDEPTAALGVKESGNVLDLIMRLKAAGRGVVIISHNMHHVFSVADRIMVLRRGALAGLRRKNQTTPDEIVAMIVGSQLAGKEKDHSAEHRDAGVVAPASGE
jgi:D-xylose transport system ATP-binding protein